jgi:hypothetical protein
MGIVTEKLHAATSKIHLSFDLWTPRNLRALLGVNCYFADEFGNLKTLSTLTLAKVLATL